MTWNWSQAIAKNVVVVNVHARNAERDLEALARKSECYLAREFCGRQIAKPLRRVDNQFRRCVTSPAKA